MSTSLRDQLLKVGLINQKQVNEAERQQQRRDRQDRHDGAQRSAPRQAPPAQAAAPRTVASPQMAPQAAKLARDMALNRKQQEKAERKARQAQIKQLVEQHQLPSAEGDQPFNFQDGAMIRKIAVAAANRDALGRGELAIVRHAGRYALVPAAIAARIRERDPQAVVELTAAQAPTADEAYAAFPVPDDLYW